MEYLNRSLKPLCGGSCYHPHFTGGTTEAQLVSHKLILESRPQFSSLKLLLLTVLIFCMGLGVGWVMLG